MEVYIRMNNVGRIVASKDVIGPSCWAVCFSVYDLAIIVTNNIKSLL